jgi:hypothetical protein
MPSAEPPSEGAPLERNAAEASGSRGGGPGGQSAVGVDLAFGRLGLLADLGLVYSWGENSRCAARRRRHARGAVARGASAVFPAGDAPPLDYLIPPLDYHLITTRLPLDYNLMHSAHPSLHTHWASRRGVQGQPPHHHRPARRSNRRLTLHGHTDLPGALHTSLLGSRGESTHASPQCQRISAHAPW